MVKVSKIELEDVVNELSEHKGRHTEFISVLIPEGYDVNSVQRQLEAEKATAKNIKSSQTRKNVIEALEKIVRYLKDLKRTPENGLALFSGNISKVEGQDDLKLWVIEPPMPLKTRLYRCDKEFVLEPLREQLEVTEVFGLLVMDRKEATIGVLIGKRIEVLQHMTSGIPSQIRAGGQSSQRFHRITEGLTREYYKRVAGEMKKAFYDMPKLKGIIIGGPIPTKDEFLDWDYLPTKLKEKVIGRRDIGNTDESGLHDLVEESRDLLEQQELVKEQKLLEKFFRILGEDPDMALYHVEEIRKALQYGAVDLLIFSKDYDKKAAIALKKSAENIGASIEVVSEDTEEGQQFKSLSGIGALLRFKV